MIARILPQGQGVAGLLRYLFGPGRKNEHEDPRIVAAWNGAPGRLEPPRDDRGRPRVGRLAGLLEQPLALLGDRAPDSPVWHFMARCHPKDPQLPDRAWAAITTELMHRLGLSRRGLEHAGVRWVAVCHGDNHVHVVATLARQDGGRARLSRERVIAGQVRQWAEAGGWTTDLAERDRYQLRSAPAPDRTAARRPTRAEAEKARRNERPEAPRVTLRKMVQAAAAGARTEAEFAARLAELGALARWRTSPATGEVTGYTVGLPGDLTAARPGAPARQVWYSGRRLAPDLSWPKLAARWAGPRLSGQAMTWEAARAILAREVTRAARSARTEAEFESALARAGLLVHWRAGPGPQADRASPAERTGADRGGPSGRTGTGRTGPSGRTGADRSARTGYAVSLPGLAGPGGQPRWIAGGQLADDLALGALRKRWAAGRAGAAPGPEEMFGGADQGAIYDYAARVADWAAAQVRASPPGQASDAAWAAADVLAAAYAATRNPGLRQAAAGLERAARPPWGRIPERAGAGDALRTAAWCLYRCQPRHSPGRALLAALARLADAIAALRRAQQHAAQAEAARRAAEWIRAPGTATAFRPQAPTEAALRAARRASGPQPRRGRGL